METGLSIPVIWTEDGGSPHAGRLDVRPDGLTFDGGSRGARRARAVDYTKIAAARIEREVGARINGRPAIVLHLRDGGTLSFVGFDRPGTLLELIHRIETSI